MKRSLISVCCLLVAYLSFSQDNSKEYFDLINKGISFYRAKEYKNAAITFSSAISLAGNEALIIDRHRAAFSWALANYPDSAFYHLNIIANLKDLSFNDVDDIITDEDYTSILKDKRWQDVKNKMLLTAYKTFLMLQREAGLDVDTSNINHEALRWALGNSVDSIFSHLNDRAYLLLKKKNFNEAYRHFKVSLNSFPRNYTFTRDIGDYYTAMGDKTRAFVYYFRALDLKYYRVMFDSAGLSKIDSALTTDYRQLSEQTGLKALPTENLLFTVANQLMRRGMTGKAYALHKLNIEYHPNSFRANRGMSDYYTSAGNKGKAENYNTKSLLLQYRLPEIFFEPSFNVGEYIISRYENVSKQRGFKVLTPEAMINTLGNYFLTKKMFEKAELLFKMNVENYPHSPAVYNKMSNYYKVTGDKVKEEEFSKKAQSIKNNPGIQNFSGNIPVADTSYNIFIQNPVCVKNCATILIDEAHSNYHTATGRYKPFANLLANDGFRVIRGQTFFTRQLLEHINVVVIASTGTITNDEVKILNEWIRRGGSLLAITDHDNPNSNDLLNSVGVQTPDINYTVDTLHGTFSIRFSKKEKLLGNHPILNGRDSSEKISRVTSFTGRTIIGPAGCSVLLPLSDSAVDYMTIDPSLRSIEDMIAVQVKGLRSHGVAFIFGKGKVVAVSEAAMLTAQLFPPDGQPVGMNVPGSDNRQFALNIMRWLTGYLK